MSISIWLDVCASEPLDTKVGERGGNCTRQVYRLGHKLETAGA